MKKFFANVLDEYDVLNCWDVAIGGVGVSHPLPQLSVISSVNLDSMTFGDK